MTVEDYCTLIRCASECGVETVNIDNFSIKFHNGSSTQIKVEEIEPIFQNSDKPNHPEINTEGLPEATDSEDLMKSEELSLMMIEDPQKFEELLANDDELLKEFEHKTDELRED